MPVQTTVKGFIHYPDGAKVEIDDGTGYADIGLIDGDVANTFSYDRGVYESANAGKLDAKIRNMRIEGSFNLGNLDPEGVERFGGGLFERVDVAGTSQTPEDQVLDDPAVLTAYDLVLLDSNGNNLRPTTTPTITTVTGDATGPIASSAYDVFVKEGSPSGYGISFESGAVTGSEDVTIDYGATTMRASQILYAGSSSAVLTAYSMRLTHTDDNGLIRRLELFSVDPGDGGFQFNFMGATSDGIETMPLSYEAKIDTTKTNNRQLFAWTVEDGAE